MPNVELDFRMDWVKEMKARLARLGYTPDPNAAPGDVGVIYANAILRRIELRPRSVLESRDLVVPPELREGFDLFVAKAKRGENLNSHLSKGIGRPEEPDPLFNDWGIYHFHLGRKMDGSGFIERTGPLLFAYVTDASIYLLNVLKHGAWANQRFVQCLHENWPDVIASRRLHGFTAVEPVPTDEDIKELRKAGVFYCLTMPDGTIYAPLGGGYATDGTGVRAVTESDRAFFEADRLEEYVQNNIDELSKAMAERGTPIPETFRFRLVFENDGLYALDEHVKIKWRLPRVESS